MPIRIKDYPALTAMGSSDALLVDGAAGTFSLPGSDALYQLIEATGSYGLRRSVCRNKNLGTSLTTDQISAISSGLFTDMFPGDYWVINSTTWRIVDLDYFYNSAGSTTKHHVVVIPDVPLTSGAMYASASNSSGMSGSNWTTTYITTCLTAINNAFGSTYILPITRPLSTTVTSSGVASASLSAKNAWLPTQNMLFGHVETGSSAYGQTVMSADRGQLAYYSLNPLGYTPGNGVYLTLDNPASTTGWVTYTYQGLTQLTTATTSSSYRPFFCIGA